jgi:hypothetical protein
MLTEGSSGAITIRTWRGRVQFDDQGIIVKNLFRTYQVSWTEVRRFWDLVVNSTGPGLNSPVAWTLIIVLHNGQTVTAWATSVSCWKLFYGVMGGTMEDVPCSCACPSPG